MISFLFFTFPFFQNGEVKIKKLENKNGNVITPLPPPPGLRRRLMEPSAEEVGLIVPVFLQKLLDTDMPCD